MQGAADRNKLIVTAIIFQIQFSRVYRSQSLCLCFVLFSLKGISKCSFRAIMHRFVRCTVKQYIYIYVYNDYYITNIKKGNNVEHHSPHLCMVNSGWAWAAAWWTVAELEQLPFIPILGKPFISGLMMTWLNWGF